ncbi:MAG: hypothetical protein KKG42_18860, partial [Gammaproteobacteria bacterium]|nr:hypothetical protein [Gammaproteobacteria bacterium]
MKSKEILDAEICLLLLKYGEQACIKSLAGHLGRPAELLRLDILKFQSRSTRPSSQKARQASAFRIDDLVAQYPTKAEALRKLNSRFESKEFLPELKDVRRFFDRHSGTAGALKSRGAAQA